MTSEKNGREKVEEKRGKGRNRINLLNIRRKKKTGGESVYRTISTPDQNSKKKNKVGEAPHIRGDRNCCFTYEFDGNIAECETLVRRTMMKGAEARRREHEAGKRPSPEEEWQMRGNFTK